MNTPAFAPGQRWTYRTRPGEETSTALVLAIDAAPGGEHSPGHVVSIKLDSLRLPHAGAPGGFISTVGHLPIAEQNLRQSVLELVESDAAIPDEEGYGQWREAFERGEAGVFTVPLAEIVEGMAQALAPAAAPNVFGKSRFGL